MAAIRSRLTQHYVDVLCGRKPSAVLKLYSRALTDEDAQFIAKHLKLNKHLTSVDLSSNNIGDEGARYLANALSENRTLKILDLRFNNLTIEGLRCFVGDARVKCLCDRDNPGDGIPDDDGAGIHSTSSLHDTLAKNYPSGGMNDDGSGHQADALVEGPALTGLHSGSPPNRSECSVAKTVEGVQNPNAVPPEFHDADLTQALDILHPFPEFIDSTTNNTIFNCLREQQQTETVNTSRVKVMLVGPGEAGKTALVHRLKTGNFLANAQMTDGIDVNEWRHAGVSFYFWDFGGQAVYLNTHPMFFSGRTIFVLVFNPRIYVARDLEPYLDAVRNCAPHAPLIVVTTRAAEVAPLGNSVLEEIGAKFGPLMGNVHLDSRTGEGIEELKKQLVKVAKAQPHVTQQVPRQFLEVQQHLAALCNPPLSLSHRLGVSKPPLRRFHISAAEYYTIAGEMFGMNEDIARRLLELLHDWGVVYVLPAGHQIVLAPQQLADVLACVITAHQQSLEQLGTAGREGLLLHSQLDAIWHNYAPDLRPLFLALLHDCELAYELRDQHGRSLRASVVPAMLPERPPGAQRCEEDELKRLFLRDVAELPSIRVALNSVPEQFMARLQVRLRSMVALGGAWRSGFVLRLQDRISIESHSVCIVQRVPNLDGLLFLAGGFSAAAQTKAIHALERLREEEFPRLCFTDVQLIVAGRAYGRDDIREALEEDGARACIVHKKSRRRVPVAKLARLVGYDLGSQPRPSELEPEIDLQTLPEWLRPLAALLEAADEHGQQIDDDTLEQLDDELRRCVLEVVAACGLPNHKLGVRCLWLVDRSSTPLRAVAISPPAPNTTDHWHIVEQCSVQLAHSEEAIPALPQAAEAVILRVLDELGVVGALTRFALLRLESERNAIRAAYQQHFEPLSGMEDKLLYWRQVVETMKMRSMQLASLEVLQQQTMFFEMISSIHSALERIHLAVVA